MDNPPAFPSEQFSYVLDYYMGGYVEGFDRNQQYEFIREGWDAPAVFRLADMDPAFNVGGLKYRPIAARKGESGHG